MGYFLAPLDPPPPDRCTWEGRFDDPKREFQTLYCAKTPATALHEKLANLRRSVEAKKVFEDAMGYSPFDKLPLRWREENVLVEARLEVSLGDLVSLADFKVRQRLEDQPKLRDLLIRLEISGIDMGVILGRERKITQAIARCIYDWGEAGVLYPSRHDIGQCAALFEGRARLVAADEPRPLTDDLPELLQVCEEIGLLL